MTNKTNTTAIESIDQLSVGSKLVLNNEGRGFFSFMNLLTGGNDPITNTLEDVGYLEVTGFVVDEEGEDCVVLKVTKGIDKLIPRLKEIKTFEILYSQILEHFELLEEEVKAVTFKEGDKVRSLITVGNPYQGLWYVAGEVYKVGYDTYGDFGVIDNTHGNVNMEGMLKPSNDCPYQEEQFDVEQTLKNFELVK